MLRCPAYSVMQTVLDNMIEQKILEHFLTSEGIDAMEGREDDFKSFKEKILDDETMKESHNEGVITDAGIEFLFRTHYFADSFYSVMKEKKNYSEKELRKYYDEHKDNMSKPVLISGILRKFDYPKNLAVQRLFV